MTTYQRPHAATLLARLREESRWLIVVTGPRQTGKTTLVEQVRQRLLRPSRRVAVDAPDSAAAPSASGPAADTVWSATEPSLPSAGRRDARWLVRQWEAARLAAKRSERGFILALDEIQKIPNWSETVKGLWDQDRLDRLPLHVVLLGSAPLLMQQGLTESLAGRYEVIELAHWSFGEMAAAFDFELDEYLYFGGYPGPAPLIRSETRWREFIRRSLIEPNIERDILALRRVDKPALLKRLFELGSRYSGRILSYNKMLGQLEDAGNTATLAHYLDLLSSAGLIAGLPKYAGRLHRRRASSPKLNVLNGALMSVHSDYAYEEARADRSFWGRVVESAVGAHLVNTGGPEHRVYYWRDRRGREVDFVLERGRELVAFEVRSGARLRAVTGLDAFKENFSGKGVSRGGAGRDSHFGIPADTRSGVVRGIMKHFVERTCAVVHGGGEDGGPGSASRPLESFRERKAYVLLGAPGSGKTEAFKREADRAGGRHVPARDFLTFDGEGDWREEPLYIDGLDEIRAGTADGRAPFDRIRAKLQRLGRPPFRLSCREADWFGANDGERLRKVAPDGDLSVLRLEPLREEGILKILEKNLGVADPRAFLTEARERGIGDLLGNPHNLEMVAAAVADDAWPRTRRETFELACRKLIEERNEEHRIAESGSCDVDTLMDAAGRLCAVLLLSGKAGVTLPGTEPNRDYPGVDQVSAPDPGIKQRVVRRRVFASPSEGRVTYSHRQVAEFLAGRHLARLIRMGLPFRRVLALVTGFDGGILSEFRGLAAWLAAHSVRARSELGERDPVGTVLYGDVGLVEQPGEARSAVATGAELARESLDDWRDRPRFVAWRPRHGGYGG